MPWRGSGRVPHLRIASGNLRLVHPQSLHADVALSGFCGHLEQGLPDDSDVTLATKSALPHLSVDVSRTQAMCCGPGSTGVMTRSAQATGFGSSCQRSGSAVVPFGLGVAASLAKASARPAERGASLRGSTPAHCASLATLTRVLRVASRPPGGGLSRRTGALSTSTETASSSHFVGPPVMSGHLRPKVKLTLSGIVGLDGQADCETSVVLPVHTARWMDGHAGVLDHDGRA